MIVFRAFRQAPNDGNGFGMPLHKPTEADMGNLPRSQCGAAVVMYCGFTQLLLKPESDQSLPLIPYAQSDRPESIPCQGGQHGSTLWRC